MNDILSLPREVLSRAMRPRLDFGHSLLAEASRSWGRYLMVTTPEPWEVARKMLSRPPHHVHLVRSIDRIRVEREEAELPACDTVVGLGGGVVLDIAKYVGWRRNTEPVLIPSIASVDACVTNSIGIRDQGRVRYVGFVLPQVVIVDFALIQSAPIHLNRAGIGDILSIHTALWDWEVAARCGQGAYEEDVARQARILLNQLVDHTQEIRAANEDAIRWLIEAYATENRLCLQVGHSRPEEGSEHFFAYNVEYRTAKTFIHGELVALGILLMARLQDNDSSRVERILDETGVRFQPKDLKLSSDEVVEALIALPAYTRAEKLPYSIVDERPPDLALIREICRGLEF